MKLFIDDERQPYDSTWIVARNISEAKEVILNNTVHVMSLDHDLGGNETVMDIVKWMVEMDMDGEINIPNDFTYLVHSANPVGAKNIKNYLDQYLKLKFG